MQTICYDVAASIDGYIAGPHGALDAFLFDGPHVAAYLKRLAGYGTAIMGRATYEAGYAFGMAAGANPYPHLKTVVFSKTLEVPPGADISIIREDSLAYIDQLRAAEGPGIYLCGGGLFASWLLGHGRLDVVRIKQNPILLGGGVPLFVAVEDPPALTLSGHCVHPNGVVDLRYDLRGG